MPAALGCRAAVGLGLARASPGRRAQSALAQLRGLVEEQLEGIRGAGTWKSERVITSPQGPSIRVEGVPGGNLRAAAARPRGPARPGPASSRAGFTSRPLRPGTIS